MVSVIIPVYNTEKYIKKCLRSVVQQSYKELEIIIINDGSTDASLDICKKLAIEDNRIQIISIENSGVSKARNQGLLLAKGEYVCFVDADDYIDRDYIEKYVKIAFETNADIVIGGILEEKNGKTVAIRNKNLVIEGKDCRKIVCSLLDCKSDEKESYSPQVLGFSCCKLYKKTVISEISFPENIPVREDTIYNIEVLLKAKKIVISDLLGYHYNINISSATGRYRINYSIEAEKFLKKCKEIWIANNLPMNSYYIGCLYTYMRWLKLHTMHPQSNHSLYKQILLIKKSFDETMWTEAFKKVNSSSLNVQYKLLRRLFIARCAFGIYGLCRVSYLRRRH